MHCFVGFATCGSVYLRGLVTLILLVVSEPCL